MNQFRQIIHICTKAILLAAFSVCLTLYPLAFTLDGEVKTPITGISDLMQNMDNPFHHLAYHSPLTILPQRETFSILEYIKILSRSIRNTKNFLCGNFNIFELPGQFKLLIIFSILSSYRMANNHISIIALKIGGHAPPLSFSFSIKA